MDGAGDLAGAPSSPPRNGTPWDQIPWVAIGLAVMPIVVAAVRAIVEGWLPIGDNAYFTIRSRDVLGSHHPLVGAWSSGSTAIGTSVNNLGPLQLDLLAPFTKVAPAAGTAVGVATVNAAAVIGIGITARRVAGPLAVVIAMAATALTAWTMGSALLIEPRQHHALLLPFLCYLVLTWAVATGDAWCLPWAAFVASVLVQTHFTYVLLVPVLAVYATAMLVVVAWRTADDRRRWQRLRLPVAVTVGVLIVCWSQSLIDQFFESGNLGRVRQAAGAGEPGLGLSSGARVVATAAAAPATWLRAGFRDFDPADGLLGGGGAALALTLLAAVLATAAAVAWRRGDRPAVVAVLTAAVALAAGWVAATRTPVGQLGAVPGNYRWLWPTASFTSLAVVLGLVPMRPDARRPVGAAVTGAAGAVLLFLSVANVPAAHQVPVVVDDLPRLPVTRELLAQLDRIAIDGPVLFDRSRGLFGEPYSYATLLRLQQRGIEFRFDTDADTARFGKSRAAAGEPIDERLIVVTGGAARDDLPGAERVAFVAALTPAEVNKGAALRTRMIGELVDGGLMLSSSGRDAVAAGEYPAYSASALPEAMSDFELGSELRRMVAAEHVDATAEQAAALAEWLELEDRERDETVAVFLAPA